MNKLEIELNEYLKTTPVNAEELAALKEWVADGNSVHHTHSDDRRTIACLEE